MLNRMIIMGRLTHEPELRHTAAAVPVASFSIAHERDYKDSDGNKITDFYDVVAWRNTAEFAAKWLSKGRLVVVCGKTQLRTCTDSEGRKRIKLELHADGVYFADSGSGERTQRNNENAYFQSRRDNSPQPQKGASVGEWKELDDEDGDFPFKEVNNAEDTVERN